ncbi:hypothetical protein FO440_11970 [Mucilaginibacter corticis]|uniref:Uncharacterized protein n=1 Tax=Mucilaginibacter corticis TaxID=2597670 RepID=A0A556MKM9_9SPHI|nr:hypothetical protein [Mucilaginibacter corticis]TSJ40466.1 hypothetical protein FO440_11970 [Mucilaginibacter corticis]
MKKLFLILLIFTLACSTFQNKQQQAERTVKEYIHSKNPKANIKDIKFSDLDPNGNVIGVIKNKIIYDSSHHPFLLSTVYYTLNKDLTQVKYVYTN